MTNLYGVDIDLLGNQILNARLQVLATPPANLGEAHIFYNSTTKKVAFWDGTQWVYVPGATVVVSLDAGNDITAGTDGGAFFSETLTSLGYNAATAVLSYVDENGATTTHNLPIENFLANATYNDTTHILTLTLEGGGTVDVDLGDLVEEYDLEVTDSTSIDLTLTGTGSPADPWDITAVVKVSADAGNQVSIKPDGLYVAAPGHYETGVSVGSSVGFVNINHGLNTMAVDVQVWRQSDNRQIGIRVDRVDADNIRVRSNGAPFLIDVVVTRAV